MLANAGPVCVAVAHVLPGRDSQRRWPRTAPALHAAAMRLSRALPTWHDRLRLLDGTPPHSAASRVTVNRRGLGGIAG
ncbi:hypothetical protein DEF23_26500 [Marinitenerispora sediminis]|uniref:Uncharacterized protein n=1 Tax=Marinitenerispora sediminis TaxID=1931232 RepID=A0A368SXZ6_9ACTN|nr:hypothetical protein DEF28_26280 [Marinitenerispora sediminis]RCV47583.1 hypothetical protein DEF23_26500 [Marinitenerispora sediminis]RCV48436.1 hypothetical protein DEF24_26315 [Marinitenerispora sediminis]